MSKREPSVLRSVLGATAVAIVAIAGFWWQHVSEDARHERLLKQAQPEAQQADLPSAPSATTPAEPPLGDRPIAQFPQPAPWVAGDVRGQAWPPVRAASNWLVIAPDFGEDASVVLPLVQNLWRHRDIGAVVLATVATPTESDAEVVRTQVRHRLRQTVDALAVDGRRVVLLGAGRQGEAMLQMANDPKVLAVAALEPSSPLPGLDAPHWQSEARKKLVYLHASGQSANALDALGRHFPHAITRAEGPRAGLNAIADPNRRAGLAGWLFTALGPPR